MDQYYHLIKAFHIISFTAWMAGMFYLPRLYAYHAGVKAGSETSELFKVMERRLLRIIINPAMILTLFFGIMLIVITEPMKSGWFHSKLGLLIVMFSLHGYLAGCRRKFANDSNTKSPRFYKILNELVTFVFIPIVLLTVLKPF